MNNIFFYQKIDEYFAKRTEATQSELIQLLQDLHCAHPFELLASRLMTPNETCIDSNHPDQIYRPPFILEKARDLDKGVIYKKRVTASIEN